jgi:hypothetical protein
MSRTGSSGAKNATLKYDPLGRLFEVAGAGGDTCATRFPYDCHALAAPPYRFTATPALGSSPNGETGRRGGVDRACGFGGVCKGSGSTTSCAATVSDAPTSPLAITPEPKSKKQPRMTILARRGSNRPESMRKPTPAIASVATTVASDPSNALSSHWTAGMMTLPSGGARSDVSLLI